MKDEDKEGNENVLLSDDDSLRYRGGNSVNGILGKIIEWYVNNGGSVW
jgi:hypothetical protein